MNIKHIANLANLKLTPAELKKFQNQLGEVLNYVKKLKSVKTQTVKPTSQVTGLENVLRADEVSYRSKTSKGFFTIKGIKEKWN